MARKPSKQARAQQDAGDAEADVSVSVAVPSELELEQLAAHQQPLLDGQGEPAGDEAALAGLAEYDLSADTSALTAAGNGKRRDNNFLEKLWNWMATPEGQSIMAFSGNGRYLVVFNPDAVPAALSNANICKHKDYFSFQRQCCIYGWRRISTNELSKIILNDGEEPGQGVAALPTCIKVLQHETLTSSSPIEDVKSVPRKAKPKASRAKGALAAAAAQAAADAANGVSSPATRSKGEKRERVPKLTTTKTRGKPPKAAAGAGGAGAGAAGTGGKRKRGRYDDGSDEEDFKGDETDLDDDDDDEQQRASDIEFEEMLAAGGDPALLNGFHHHRHRRGGATGGAEQDGDDNDGEGELELLAAGAGGVDDDPDGDNTGDLAVPVQLPPMPAPQRELSADSLGETDEVKRALAGHHGHGHGHDDPLAAVAQAVQNAPGHFGQAGSSGGAAGSHHQNAFGQHVHVPVQSFQNAFRSSSGSIPVPFQQHAHAHAAQQAVAAAAAAHGGQPGQPVPGQPNTTYEQLPQVLQEAFLILDNFKPTNGSEGEHTPEGEDAPDPDAKPAAAEGAKANGHGDGSMIDPALSGIASLPPLPPLPLPDFAIPGGDADVKQE